MTEIFDDILSLYKFQEPCLELKDYIEFFSESDLGKSAFFIENEVVTVKLFPSFTPTIWLNLGGAYQISSVSKVTTICSKTDVLVLRASTLERRILPNDHIFTIKFHPGSFETIFGISQAKIAEDIIDVRQLFLPSVIRKIKNLFTFEEKVNEIEKLLLAKIKENQYNGNAVMPIKLLTDEFIKSNMSIKNGHLASKLFLSEKTFYRHFTQTIGTNPKNYFNILRARSALIAYKANQSTFSPYDFGYYDHGHFSKDVVSFTSKSLRQLSC